MSLVLLDTHSWLWLLNGSRSIGRKSRKAIEEALSDGAVLVSAISAWEVAMLVAKGRLVLDRDVGEWIATALELPGMLLEPMTPDIAVASTRLPGDLHGDPADRIIAATARHCSAVLITEDRLLLDYGKAGHVKTISASQ